MTSWYPDDALERVEYILSRPDYRRDPLPASTIAALVGVRPSAVYNLAYRPHTGVKRYPGGYDVWEVQRWLLSRRQSQVRGPRGGADTRVGAALDVGLSSGV